MSRKFKPLLLVFVFTLLLGALSVQAQERIIVTWFVGLGAGGQPQQIEAQNRVVEEFNASQSEIELQIQIVENNVAGDTLSTLIASQQTPDIVGPVGYDGANAFAGQYLDIQPLVDAASYDLSQFPEAAVNAYRVEGEGLLGLPFATFPSFIYYRRGLFDEAGLEYPPHEYGAPYADGDEWTMDKLRELAMFLTVDANGNDATSADFDPENVIQWGFVSQWNETRGYASLFGASHPFDAEGNAVLTEPYKVGLQWFYDGIWQDHFIPNSSQISSDLLAAGNPFSSGNVAMAHSHLWYTCCIGEQNDWDIAAVPSHNGVITAKLHGDTFRIMKATKNPEAAFTVLTYLVGEASPELLQVYGGMPAREEEQEAFFAALDERFPQGVDWSVATASLNYADSPSHEAFMPNYLKAKDRLGAFQTLMESTPGLDLQAELEKLVADLQAIADEVK